MEHQKKKKKKDSLYVSTDYHITSADFRLSLSNPYSLQKEN